METPSLAKTFVPIAEQQRAVELFSRQEGLRVNAYAGTGKTTTLRLLASSTSQRGLYLAFNRNIAGEARQTFPAQVTCVTAHSLAFRQIRRNYGYPEWKLTEKVSPRAVTEAFRMPELVSFASGMVLPRHTYAGILLRALRHFLQSDTDAPEAVHMPRQGYLEAVEDGPYHSFRSQALEHVRALWHAMQVKEAGLPLGHDGYLKLWALSKPEARTDYILVDEAQDLNPVLLGVLQRVRCPLVYVGDPYQQIYDWRGAINAMDMLPTRHQVLLSQSFRFGPEIAAAATVVLRQLGAQAALRGSPHIDSHLARVRPQAILSRSNAGVIGNVLQLLQRGVRCAVIGGTRELERLLQDVQKIKGGHPAQDSDLLGFTAWKDVVAFSRQPEGEHLRSLVNLVQEHGEERMLFALSRCEPNEASAQVVCSTGHRAKGREWGYVRVDPDFEAGFVRSDRLQARNPHEGRFTYEAEARLLYVAITRAQQAVHLPLEIRKRFGLRNTTTELLRYEKA